MDWDCKFFWEDKLTQQLLDFSRFSNLTILLSFLRSLLNILKLLQYLAPLICLHSVNNGLKCDSMLHTDGFLLLVYIVLTILIIIVH